MYPLHKYKLVQSNDGFNLYNLAEIRYFLKYIDKERRLPVIDDTLWSDAKNRLTEVYAESSCLPNCLNLLNEFESVNSIKFRSDLDEFIKESNFEDFYADEYEAVYVSTIHKSKGREFDTVYLLLKNVYASSDEEKRKLYVALTRAKNTLYIHCNTNVFYNYSIDGIIKRVDTAHYDNPLEISLQLTHKDVVLNYFKDKKELILNLHSGYKLDINDNYLSAEVKFLYSKINDEYKYPPLFLMFSLTSFSNHLYFESSSIAIVFIKLKLKKILYAHECVNHLQVFKETIYKE